MNQSIIAKVFPQIGEGSALKLQMLWPEYDHVMLVSDGGFLSSVPGLRHRVALQLWRQAPLAHAGKIACSLAHSVRLCRGPWGMERAKSQALP